MKEVKDEDLSISLGTAAARSLSFHPARYLRRDVTVDPNVFETANAGFAQAIYEEFLRDPTAVDPEWRRLVEGGGVGQEGSGDGGRKGSNNATASRVGSAAPSQLPSLPSSHLPSGPAAQQIKGPAAK